MEAGAPAAMTRTWSAGAGRRAGRPRSAGGPGFVTAIGQLEVASGWSRNMLGFRDAPARRGLAPRRSRKAGVAPSMNDVARCAGPGCGKPLTRLATGRPPRYCGPNCRKAAQRDRDRRADAERQRAEQLATARAAANRAWRHLEEDAYEAGELASAVVTYAAADDRHALAVKLAEFREAARRVEALAIEYSDATALAARLTQPDGAAPASVTSTAAAPTSPR